MTEDWVSICAGHQLSEAPKDLRNLRDNNADSQEVTSIRKSGGDTVTPLAAVFVVAFFFFFGGRAPNYLSFNGGTLIFQLTRVRAEEALSPESPSPSPE